MTTRRLTIRTADDDHEDGDATADDDDEAPTRTADDDKQSKAQQTKAKHSKPNKAKQIKSFKCPQPLLRVALGYFNELF